MIVSAQLQMSQKVRMNRVWCVKQHMVIQFNGLCGLIYLFCLNQTELKEIVYSYCITVLPVNPRDNHEHIVCFLFPEGHQNKELLPRAGANTAACDADGGKLL